MNKEQKVLDKVITNSVKRYFDGVPAKEAIRLSVDALTDKEKCLLRKVNKEIMGV